MPERFKDQYQQANDRLHAPAQALDAIREKTAAPQGHLRWTRYACAAAAAVVLLGGTLGLTLRSHGQAVAATEMYALTAEDASAEAAEAPMAIAGSTAFASMAAEDRQEAPVADSTFVTPQDYDALYALLPLGNQTDGIKEEAVPSAPETMAKPDSGAAMDGTILAEPNGAGADYSTTNQQVAGVDEPDIVKTDGSHIYYLSGGKLHILAARGTDTAELSCTEVSVPGQGNAWYTPLDLFLVDDTLTVLVGSTSWVWDAGSRDNVLELVYDIADRSAPRLVGTYGQSGSFSTARLVNGTIYLITNQYLWNNIARDMPESFCPVLYANGDARPMAPGKILVNTRSSQAVYTVVGTLCPATPDHGRTSSAVLGANSTAYMTTEHLLLSSTEYHHEQSDIAPDSEGRNVCTSIYYNDTSLVLFHLTEQGPVQTAATVIDGYLTDQYALHEMDGVFCAVTTVDENITRIYTDGIDTYEWDNNSYNCLFTLDGSLQPLGSVENLAEGEHVESVRFDKNICYITTFRTVDPLFSVDISDPASPRVLGALKIDGYSDYLHPYGDGLLLGIGYAMDTSTGWNQVVRLTMFDTTDPTDVRIAADARADDAYWTQVSVTPQAVLVNSAKNLIAFPTEKGYYVYGYEQGTGFTRKAMIPAVEDTWGDGLRGLYIQDLFYVLTENAVHVLSLDTFHTLCTVPLR